MQNQTEQQINECVNPEWLNTHREYCCVNHGCRFNLSQCPVVAKWCKQTNECGNSSICSEYRHRSNKSIKN